ncbi:transposase [Trichonephila clavipes]|uniref:Transposase n=1 Tax=Trichonephila clavipes TaxID=2585209 RepID=A0A8X6SB98_TRICX|nr:transposase [Trichonephila clavipes]
MNPPYCPDLARSDYYLFLVLQNFLSDKKSGSREDCENRLLDVFANKGQDFYERGIMKLPLKWQQIIQQNGAYLTQIGQSEAFARGLSATVFVILNHGQVTRTTPELARSLIFHTTPTGGCLSLDRFNTHRPLRTVDFQRYQARTHDAPATSP